MGLLDDAIREHLELKRRHGADVSEVARQEREALGPVDRDALATAQAAEMQSPADPPSVEESAAPDPAPLPLDSTPPAPDPAPLALDADVTPAPVDAGQETVAFSLADLAAAEAEADADASFAARPEDSAPEAATAAPGAAASPEPAPVETPVQDLAWDAPTASPPPVEPDPSARDVAPVDEEPGEHDELEETPDFLQETPEHDRLWFEQKPPRDFNF